MLPTHLGDGIYSLLSRPLKKAVISKGSKSYDTIIEPEKTNPKTYQLIAERSFTTFKVFQARVYTKGEGNTYNYTPVSEINPPDNIPFQLKVEEEQSQNRIVPAVTTPPASPTQSEFHRPHLKINTTLPGPCNIPVAPPSPPSSAGAQAPEAFKRYERQYPIRAPPSPPIVFQPLPASPPFLNVPDDIIIHVFSHLDSLSSMGSLALTHSRFHEVLAPNKLVILRYIVHNISPSTYSLVELLKSSEARTAKSYIKDYVFSREIVGALKALIQSRCQFLQPEKVDFHNQTTERAFEDALYNIWAFCIVFRDQAEDISKQMNWLRKFGLGELLDILEIWQCLGVLLRPLTDCPDLAMRYGVIQNRPLSSNYSVEVVAELEEWISFIQTRGLDTLKPIVEWTETEHVQRYAIIVSKQLNKWRKQRDKPHSTFLKDAASQVYLELSLATLVPINLVGDWGLTTET